MATVNKVYVANNILQGPANVYVNVPAPASHVPPTADIDEITLDVNGQPPSGGTHVGSIDGPAVLTITEKFDEIGDDQHESPIDVAFQTVDGELDFIVKEFNPSLWATLFTNNSMATETSLTGGLVLQLGGTQSTTPTLCTLMFVQADRANPGKWIYVFAFKCYLKSALPLTMHRKAASVAKVKFGIIADLTRVVGDELAHVVRTK